MKRALALLGAGAVLGGTAATALAAQRTIGFTSVTRHQSQQGTTFTSTADDFAGGRRVGHDRLRCVFSPRQGRANCTVVVTRSDGTITLRFVSREEDSGGPLTVAGGTGAYDGATGSGTYKNLNQAGTRTRVSIRVMT